MFELRDADEINLFWLLCLQSNHQERVKLRTSSRLYAELMEKIAFRQPARTICFPEIFLSPNTHATSFLRRFPFLMPFRLSSW